MKKDSTDFCCYNMEYYVNNYGNRKRFIEYDKSNRVYTFLLYDYSPHCIHQTLWYCPWCGTKLPEELGDVWEKILTEEYGIEEPAFNEDKIPEEFKTDEWWKKRGL